MNKQKLHDLRVFAAEIRLETLKIIGSRGLVMSAARCPWQMPWLYCTAMS